MAEPVPEPVLEPEPAEPPKRNVLSPDLEPTWRPQRRVKFPAEHRPLWQLESNQFVLLLLAIVGVIMLVMLGMLMSNLFHAVQSSKG